MASGKWAIWLAVAIGLAALAFVVARPSMPASGDVDATQFEKLAAKGVRVIDVRTAGEYEAGHIPGAENVPIDGLTQAAATWDKSRALAVYCATGARSANALAYLTGQGFKSVYNLSGGVATWPDPLARGSAAGGTGGGSVKVATNGKPVFVEFSGSG